MSMVDEQLATAYHEAGHAVAAWRLRARLRTASIVPGDNYLGYFRNPSPRRLRGFEQDDSARGRWYAQRDILICMAGPIAESRFCPEARPNGIPGGTDQERIVAFALALDEENAG